MKIKKLLALIITITILQSFMPQTIVAASENKNLKVIFTSQEYPAGNWPSKPLKTMNCGQTCVAMLKAYYEYKDCTLTDSEISTIKINLKESIKNIDDWLYQQYKLPINNYRGSGTDVYILVDLLTNYANLSEAKLYREWSTQDIKNSIDNGNPVIVNVSKVWGKSEAIDHFILVKGYNDNNIIINDPGRTYGENKTYTYEEFERIRVGTKAVVVDKASNQGTSTYLPLTSGIGYADGIFDTNSPVSDRRSTNSYRKYYTFDGTAGQQVMIKMTSSDFDSYLYLIGPNGNILSEDDDTAKNCNSLISIQLQQSGTYTIEATQYQPKTGRYQINLQSIASAAVPGVVSGLRTTEIGSNYIRLSWDNVAGALNYQVYCSNQLNGNYWGVGASDTNSIIINGLTSGLAYWFKVKSHNSAGDSDYSSELSVTTTSSSQSSNNQPNATANVPDVPSGLRTSSTGSNYVSLSWNGVSEAQNYLVYCCDSQNGNYWGVGASDINSITINGLSPNITYWFKIKAHNEAGDSAFSSAVNVRTNR